jgi:hypothetical protein
MNQVVAATVIIVGGTEEALKRSDGWTRDRRCFSRVEVVPLVQWVRKHRKISDRGSEAESVCPGPGGEAGAGIVAEMEQYRTQCLAVGAWPRQGESVRRNGGFHPAGAGALEFEEKGEAVEVAKREALERELGKPGTDGARGAPRSGEAPLRHT